MTGNHRHVGVVHIRTRPLVVFVTSAALCAVVLLTSACPPKTVVTVPGKVAYTANEVLKRVQELQNATIAAEAAKAIPTDVARIIVTFSVESAKVLGATPNGWGATCVQLWATAKGQIPIKWLNAPAIQVAVLAVDMALSIFVPGGVS